MNKFAEYKNNLQRTAVASVGRATFEDLTDASTSYILTKIPEHAIVTGVFVNVVTSFNDTGSATFKVGFEGDDDYWFATLDAETAAVSRSTAVEKYFPTGTGVTIAFSGGNADATIGEVEIVVSYIETAKNNGAYVE
jgi:hypothetical protein